MNKKDFTIGKLINLKDNLSLLIQKINDSVKINDDFPFDFDTKKTMVSNLLVQKELYEKIIENIESTINNFENIDDNDPYSNILVLLAFNIANHMGNPEELYAFCLD